MEAALGMSYAGKRAMVCMKHVGLNVAADPFMNSAITGANGGIIVVSADDPSMHSHRTNRIHVTLVSLRKFRFLNLPTSRNVTIWFTTDLISRKNIWFRYCSELPHALLIQERELLKNPFVNRTSFQCLKICASLFCFLQLQESVTKCC